MGCEPEKRQKSILSTSKILETHHKQTENRLLQVFALVLVSRFVADSDRMEED